jgi:hypothetical protein
MLFERVLAGIVFVGDCENGRLTRGKVCCPNCKRELEQQVPADNDAQLICPQQDRGCVRPTKTFGCQEDMVAWIEQGWDAMAWVCKQSPNSA